MSDPTPTGPPNAAPAVPDQTLDMQHDSPPGPDTSPPAPRSASPSTHGQAPIVTPRPRGDAQSTQSGSPLPMLDLPGYELLGELGHGGMGVVYKARHVKLDRLVAVKMILASKHASLQDQVRFRIEAEAVARLQHANIVQLHEVGEHEGMPFFSLEYCTAGSLDRKLKNWTPSADESAVLVETLARAMHYAHLRGVVHRDLKPANVLLTGDGTPKITDFGLAKKMDAGSDVSRSGAIMGTPSYMAPEQAAGRVHDTGPAADVYALGALLYEFLAGRPPFKGETAFQTVQMVLTEEPTPPSTLRKGLPHDLETIALKCLSKEPARRYASAEELADDLHRYRQGEPIAARPTGRLERAVKWAKRRPAMAALLGVTVLAVVALSVLSGYLVKLANEAVKQTGIAEGKAREALQQSDKAGKARDFLVSIFKISETNVLGGNDTRREILKDAEERITREFGDQPELQAELLSAIGEINHSIALTVPRAMILEVSGTVQLESAKGVPKSAVPQTLLHLEDHLTLSADARVQIVFLEDFHNEWLKPASEATIGWKACEPADAIDKRVDDLMMTFVHLPKGTFYMGWDGMKKGTKTEIKEDFEIAAHTVTQGQWQAVMNDNPSWFSRKGGGSGFVKDISDEELKLLPVEQVSWNDALTFIKKLNEREKKRGGEWLYRLPLDTEWEYACRGGATSEKECSYHFYFAKPTNDLSSEQANFDGDFPYGNAPKGQKLQRTARVGAYPPNKLGLYAMHGNVWQWCADQSEKEGPRVIRGGDWSLHGLYCRAAVHRRIALSLRLNFVGVRLARVPIRPK